MASEKLAMNVSPGRSVGFITLGGSLHDVLIRIKSQPSIYPSIDLSYSSSDPLNSPVVLDLPRNGLRLRFDGADQRLRLIEVLDFDRTRLTYRDEDIFKAASNLQDETLGVPSATGPTFRQIYKLFGPPQPGEYIAPNDARKSGSKGTYVLSYPGIAFSFPLLHTSWTPGNESSKATALLMSSAADPAVSMALFSGHAWPDARRSLFVAEPPYPRVLPLSQKSKDLQPAEIELVNLYGDGVVELVRNKADPFRIVLGETGPQDLIMELGPPDAIYKKSDRRSEIHREDAREVRSNSVSPARHGSDASEGSNYASNADTDDSDHDDELMLSADQHELDSAETFYNYFSHGFDILVAPPASVSSQPVAGHGDRKPGAVAGAAAERITALAKNQLVATKLILHGNVPGSYTFNRHRRCRWSLQHVPVPRQRVRPTSEWRFHDIRERLNDVFKDSYGSEEERRIQQEPMSVHREVGDSPSSSCEIVGGTMEGIGDEKSKGVIGVGADGGRVMGNALIWPFPGMLFEVLKNDAVSVLTVF